MGFELSTLTKVDGVFRSRGGWYSMHSLVFQRLGENAKVDKKSWYEEVVSSI